MERRAGHLRPPYQLPSGRHGLPKAFVISNQRERILDGVMQAVTGTGYPTMRIEDVIAIAGVSRRTFYDHFANKEEAFLAAYDLIADQLRAAVSGAFATGPTWPSRVRRGLSAFLTLLAREPALARVCIVEVHAAGPRALERRAQAMADFHQFLQPPPEECPSPPLSPVVAETVIGGVYEVIYSRIIARRTEELPDLLPALLYTILLPFVGPDIAAAEYHHAVSRSSERTAAT